MIEKNSFTSINFLYTAVLCVLRCSSVSSQHIYTVFSLLFSLYWYFDIKKKVVLWEFFLKSTFRVNFSSQNLSLEYSKSFQIRWKSNQDMMPTFSLNLFANLKSTFYEVRFLHSVISTEIFSQYTSKHTFLIQCNIFLIQIQIIWWTLLP